MGMNDTDNYSRRHNKSKQNLKWSAMWIYKNLTVEYNLRK